MIKNEHTVDCWQTIGVRRQRTVRLLTIDRMFVYNRPDVFLNIKVFVKNIEVIFRLRERWLSLKGATDNAQGSDCLHLLERKASLP